MHLSNSVTFILNHPYPASLTFSSVVAQRRRVRSCSGAVALISDGISLTAFVLLQLLEICVFDGSEHKVDQCGAHHQKGEDHYRPATLDKAHLAARGIDFWECFRLPC